MQVVRLQSHPREPQTVFACIYGPFRFVDVGLQSFNLIGEIQTVFLAVKLGTTEKHAICSVVVVHLKPPCDLGRNSDCKAIAMHDKGV